METNNTIELKDKKELAAKMREVLAAPGWRSSFLPHNGRILLIGDTFARQCRGLGFGNFYKRSQVERRLRTLLQTKAEEIAEWLVTTKGSKGTCMHMPSIGCGYAYDVYGRKFETDTLTVWLSGYRPEMPFGFFVELFYPSHGAATGASAEKFERVYKRIRSNIYQLELGINDWN